MAWSLKSNGYSDVTIMEKSDRIGGKTRGYRAKGTNQIVSAVFWSSDYNETMVPLFTRFGMLNDTSYTTAGKKDVVSWLTNDDLVSWRKSF